MCLHQHTTALMWVNIWYCRTQMVKKAFSDCSHIGRAQLITLNARLSYLTSPEISHSGLILMKLGEVMHLCTLIWRLKNDIDWPNGDTVFKGHIFKLSKSIQDSSYSRASIWIKLRKAGGRAELLVFFCYTMLRDLVKCSTVISSQTTWVRFWHNLKEQCSLSFISHTTVPKVLYPLCVELCIIILSLKWYSLGLQLMTILVVD